MAIAVDAVPMGWLAATFGRLDELPLALDDLRALQHAGELIDVPAGRRLFAAGDPAAGVGVVRSGRIELYRHRFGAVQVLGEVGEGGLVGDISVLRHGRHGASARATEPTSVFSVERDRWLRLLLDHPRLAVRWLVAGMAEVHSAQRRMVRMQHRTVKARVAELLLDEADAVGDVLVSQHSIAGQVGASRQSVNEALAALRRQGLAETGYRRIRVRDSAGLRRVTGEHVATPAARRHGHVAGPG